MKQKCVVRSNIINKKKFKEKRQKMLWLVMSLSNCVCV